MNPVRTGLVVGTFLALLHTVWSLFVFLGWAQPIINFSFMMHMVAPAFTVESFDLMRAVWLVIIAFAIGFVIGNVFTRIWNAFHKS